MDDFIIRRAESDSKNLSSLDQEDPKIKSAGLILAIASGVFIGSSFVFKKKGLLQAQQQAGSVAGQGHSYLSNGLWWIGMILMIIGEICNFIAYAFTQAILVTPLGALSVVISAILSSIFLKERLNFHGKVGCAQCIIGAVIIVLHAPNQHIARDIEDFKKMFFAPVFLTYAAISIVGSVVIIWRVAPKYGTKHMLVYIGICSLIGSLSVVTTQGLGAAVVKTAQGDNQFTHWFLYVLFAFVVITLLTEVNYLNKALNLFNTAMVTPVYYVIFTSLTIISSAILSQGFEAPPKSVITVVLGFSVICSGIVLLQYSKASGLDDSGIIKSPTDIINRGHRLSGSDYEPGASEIRASLGSFRRFSTTGGKTYPGLPLHYTSNNRESDNNLHRRSQSLNFGIQRKNSLLSDGGLPTIDESDRKATKSLTNSQPDSIEGKSNQKRTSTVKFSSSSPSSPSLPSSPSSSFSSIDDNQKFNNGTQRKTPIIHTTTSSISSTSTMIPPQQNNTTDKENEEYIPLNVSSFPSPLQHPINYIKQHLSPTTSVFSESGTINSETYSGTAHNLRRESSSSSGRRSQNSIGIVDKLKFNRNVGDNDDDKALVNST